MTAPSDGGVTLLAMAKRRLDLAKRLACRLPVRRDPARVAHNLADIIRARVFAIACGYEGTDDLDLLPRFDTRMSVQSPARGRREVVRRKAILYKHCTKFVGNVVTI